MMKRIFVALALATTLIFAAAVPSSAQFNSSGYVGAGASNAQTVTIPNASSYADLLYVPFQLIPGATNSTDATLAVSGNSGLLSGGPIHFRRATASGLATLVGSEIVTGQPVMVMYDGTYFDILSVSNTNLNVGSANLLDSSLQFGVPVNLQLNASVGSNNLTIAVTGNNGSNPGANNQVLIPFRDSTIANGGPKIVSLQSALSFTINSGSTMGCVSGQMCRLWVLAICSTGLECTNSAGSDVVGLCAFNALSGTSVAPINEAALQTSQSGTSGGNSAQSYYCNISSVTSRAVRILGYVEIQESSAGTWASAPTLVQLFGPGINRPGNVVQTKVVTTQTPTSTSGTSNAATALATTISTSSAANPVLVNASGNVTTSDANSNTGIVQIYRTTGSTAIGNVSTISDTGTVTAEANVTSNTAMDMPNATSIQYGVYIKSTSGASSWTFLGTDASVPTNTGVMIIEEIMGVLVPANDDAPLSMVG